MAACARRSPKRGGDSAHAGPDRSGQPAKGPHRHGQEHGTGEREVERPTQREGQQGVDSDFPPVGGQHAPGEHRHGARHQRHVQDMAE